MAKREAGTCVGIPLYVPPAAVSAMLIVSLRDFSNAVTSARISCSSTGGKAGVEDDIVCM